VTLIFKPWIAYAELMNTTNLFTDLSWRNALGQQTANALATGGKERSWLRLGVQRFMCWLNLSGCLRWNGFQSQLNLTKKGVAFKM
jgi:hypothetical protein